MSVPPNVMNLLIQAAGNLKGFQELGAHIIDAFRGTPQDQLNTKNEERARKLEASEDPLDLLTAEAKRTFVKDAAIAIRELLLLSSGLTTVKCCSCEGRAVFKNADEATCSPGGHVLRLVRCSRCGTIFSTTAGSIEQLAWASCQLCHGLTSIRFWGVPVQLNFVRSRRLSEVADDGIDRLSALTLRYLTVPKSSTA
jgi:hypothetical protein